MSQACSKIITKDFQTVLNTTVKEDFENQRNLAITLVAIGVVLTVGLIIAITYTAQLQPIIPVAFGLLLGVSVCVTISPLRKDWTSYHDKEFFDKVHAHFKEFEANDFQGLQDLLKGYHFDKLLKYSYISDSVAEVYEHCIENFQTNTLDSKRLALTEWNKQFGNSPVP